MTAMVVTGIVAVILGIVALQVIDVEVSKSTEAQSVTAEAITTSNATAVQLDNDDLVSNASCGFTPYTTNLEAGTILHSDTHPSNSTTCNYTYYANSYMTNATTRTITALVPVIMAVVIMTTVILLIRL